MNCGNSDEKVIYLGLDYGSKTVGVAVSDALGLTAQGVEIIRRDQENKLRRTLARIEQIIKERGVGGIVLGFPKNMNSTIGERAEKTLEFKAMLERRTLLPVTLWDERLTTVAAERTLIETGVRRENRKKYIDEIAAIYILQGYLDYLWTREHSAPVTEASETSDITEASETSDASETPDETSGPDADV